MKKVLKLTALSAVSISLLAACGDEENNGAADNNNDGADVNEENNTEDAAEENSGEESEEAAEDSEPLTVGASNVPHAEILEFAEPLLEEEGVEIEIQAFNDYILPNEALADGEIDANYFQHVPYLESQIDEHGFDFVNMGGIHIEPIGIYSQDYGSLEELPEGAEIIMSSSIADHGRILMMLEEEELITLEEGAGVEATIDDIAENPNDFNFQDNVEAALLPTAYDNNEGDAVLINSNYALDAGLSPTEDAIAMESADQDNPYANVVAARSEDENDARIETLVEVLLSDDVREYIEDNYEGAVVPVED
jgi:D-methionine transport system substrate-binding protein